MAQIIQQGSTPIHKFTTPYKKDSVELAVVTYSQNGRIVLEKIEDVIIDDYSILTELTQQDTLSFDEKGDVKMQIKVKSTDGKVFPSHFVYASVKEVLNKEVI